MRRALLFTDGACSGNPGPGGWAAIVRLPDGTVRELGGCDPRTTNNRMELIATIEGLRAVESLPELPVDLYTDSTYVISGITQWVHGWKRKGWTKADGEPVLNRDLWETLDRLNAMRRGEGAVAWQFVRGHSGNPGNERCDAISVAFSRGDRPPLYRGPETGYDVDLSIVPAAAPPPALRAKERRAPSGKPVYLSYLDGRLERHATWNECQARVRGRSNARFRKVTSPEEEKVVLKSWGL